MLEEVVERAATHRGTRACRLICALVALVLSRHSLAAEPPVLRLDLRTWGAVGLQASADESLKPAPQESLTFLDNSTLAVSFPVFNPQARLTTRDHPSGGTVLYHTTLVDTHTAQVKGEKSWDSVYPPHLFAALGGERMLVASGYGLRTYSRDWKLERHYLLKGFGDNKSEALIKLSPSGETVFVIVRHPDDQERVTVLAGPGLEPGAGFAVVSNGWDAVSDSHFAFVQRTQKGFDLFVLPWQSTLAPRTPPPPPVPYKIDSGCARPAFVASDLMVLAGWCRSLSLLGADGVLKRHKAFGDLLFLHKVRVARDQRRFAFMASAPRLDRTKGEEGAELYHGAHILVFNTAALSRVFEVEPPIGEQEIHRVDFALSPDGSLLAVLNGWTLTVYQLPAPEAAKASR